MTKDQKFEIIKIIIEKLLIGAIIIVVGIIGKGWLENYKYELLMKRTFYEKKYEMIDRMQLIYKKLTGQIFSCIDNKNINKCFADTDTVIIKSINDFANSINAISPYLTDKYAQTLEKYLWLYGANFSKLNDLVKYADFLEDIEADFDKQIRKELSNDNKEVCFELIDMKYSEVKKISSTEYFKLNYIKWKEWKSGTH